MAEARVAGSLRQEEQKQALLEAAEAAVQDANDKAVQRRGRTSSNTSRIVVSVLGLGIFAVGIYILSMRPTWFFTPPPPAESVQIQEASVRLMLVREASRVRRYRAEHGKLPATLADAGSTLTSITYTPQGDSTFRLVTSWGEKTIGLSSSDSVGPFLGNSLKTIASRGRP
jgi:hypothetical protein